jgi:hypothetical protein
MLIPIFRRRKKQSANARNISTTGLTRKELAGAAAPRRFQRKAK